MQTITSQAQQTINYQQERLAPYMPLLAVRMAKTYIVPFGGLLIANTIIILARATMLGLFAGVLGSLASLMVFFAVLYFGWRYAEGRWGGTTLFVAYTAVSKARRVLQSELNQAEPSDAVVHEYLTDYVNVTDRFVDTMHANGLSPDYIEKEK